MKIILSPAKTISKTAEKFESKIEFNKYTKEILKDNSNILLSKDFYKAFFMYDGLCFRNIEREDFTKEDLEYIENNLYILSALYGAVKPFDLIHPYRLDFHIKTTLGNLYKFWDNNIAKEILKDNDLVINLASEEFSKTIRPFITNEKILDFDFFEIKNNELKKHSTISKKARGKMLKYLTKNKIKDIEKIKEFNYDNYKFDEKLSTEDKFVFIRNK